MLFKEATLYHLVPFSVGVGYSALFSRANGLPFGIITRCFCDKPKPPFDPFALDFFDPSNPDFIAKEDSFFFMNPSATLFEVPKRNIIDIELVEPEAPTRYFITAYNHSSQKSKDGKQDTLISDYTVVALKKNIPTTLYVNIHEIFTYNVTTSNEPIITLFEPGLAIRIPPTSNFGKCFLIPNEEIYKRLEDERLLLEAKMARDAFIPGTSFKFTRFYHEEDFNQVRTVLVQEKLFANTLDFKEF